MNQDELIAMHESGASLAAIGRRYGVSGATIARRFRKWGFAYRGHREAVTLMMKNLPREERQRRMQAAVEKARQVNTKTPSTEGK